MAANDYVTLGRSGLRVSPLCLGAMTFGLEWGFGCDPQESRRIIDAYLDRGGNFIDTANIYTKGHAEAILGEHLGSRRERVVLATKFLGNLFPGDPNGGGAGRKSIMNACEESLRRLRTDSIDLYWMHFWDRFTPIDESMRALDDLVRAGKVRHVGFSDVPAWKCAQGQMEAIFRGWTPCIALQVEYSLLQRTVEGELIPMAREMGLGVTPWSPLKGGVLTGKYTRASAPKPGEARYQADSRHLTPKAFDVIDLLVEMARTHGRSPAQVALAWVQSRPGVASSIIGARTIAQLEDNLAALELTLTPEEIARLDAASKPTLNFPHDFLEAVGPVVHGGISINGVKPPEWDLAPKADAERY